MKNLINVLKRNANIISFGDVTGKGVESIVLHDNLSKKDLDIIESNISYAGIICYLTNRKCVEYSYERFKRIRSEKFSKKMVIGILKKKIRNI